MDGEALRHEKQELEQRYGAWTAHNIRLADGLYTLASEPTGDEVKLRRVTQIVHDEYDGEIDGLRVLDLACLEGLYALEFASRGASVVAIEGREANIAKARFAARALQLESKIDFQLGDVRDLSSERHGTFDVVLCLGILYHLADTDVFSFIDRLARVTRRLLVVDTHVALEGTEQRQFGGSRYSGHTLKEHDPNSSEDDRQAAVWSSLDNTTAWAPTRPSLIRLLARAGFTTISEVWIPAEPNKTPDRITLLAHKGKEQSPQVSPLPQTDRAAIPERPPLGTRLPGGALWRTGGRLVPQSLRRRIREKLGVETRKH